MISVRIATIPICNNKINPEANKGTERGFKGIQLKDPEQKRDVQTRIVDLAPSAYSADNLETKKENTEKENNFVAAEKCAVTAETVVEQKDCAETSPKKVIRILPSKGEPCEGSTSAGEGCGFASENYLINGEGQKSCWCHTHLTRILAAYDSKSYTIIHGLGDAEG